MLALWMLPFLVLAPCLAPRATLMQIQGRSHRSPLVDADVVTGGIVTAITPSGFYLQDARGDGDPETSDAAFVSAASVTVRVGDRVDVEGRVTERVDGDPATQLSTTEIRSSRVVVLGRHQALPPAVVVGDGVRASPSAVIDDDALEEYQPGIDGLDFYESLECMRVTIAAARAIAPPDAFGDVWVAPARSATGLNPRGGITARPLDANPERIRIRGAVAAVGSKPIPIGGGLGNVGGVLDYGRGSFEVLPGPLDAPDAPPPAPEVTSLSGDESHLLVASFNLRNFSAADPGRARRLAELIVFHMGAPDVIALEEVQDDSGPLDDGTVAADATYRLLIDAVGTAGGPRYDARDVAPVDGMDGGVAGGNIRAAFLFRPDRVAFVDRADTAQGGARSETRAAADSGCVRLTRSPGRIDPANPAWSDSRKPLAGEFLAGDRRFFVVAAHFRSRSGSGPDFGATQPPVSAGAAERARQARVVRAFVDELRGLDPDARLVVLGDFNDDWFSLPLAILEADRVLVSLARSLPMVERYTYVYDGNSRAYDHILVSPVWSNGAQFDVVHVNAEYAENASDHDPVVARLPLAAPPVAAPAAASMVAFPNPSRGEVVILTPGYPAEIDVFDVRGVRVRRLTTAGTPAVWDGCDSRGRSAASGVYYLRAIGSFGVITRRIVRVR
jgi:predicted extracellular nuclease